MEEERFNIFKSTKKHLHYQTLGLLWKHLKLLLVPESFSHYWTCLILFITCTYSKRSGSFLISILNCRIYYTLLHTVLNHFYVTHSSVLHMEFLYTCKAHQETMILQTHIYTHSFYDLYKSESLTESDSWKALKECRVSVPARNSRYKRTNSAIVCRYTKKPSSPLKWNQASPIRLGKFL